ncbi:hypothetical protein S-PM2d229 [Synechococcus phage S-PM2]|uniref:Hypothetical-Protein / belonging to T4-LIKE GC: 742 n=1 Tax=Synechococcus phage S-PM2 TaxID=238854 RepID=Q5GQA8_BPSYP|nr:Hypothetical-Protein / belonging to T4-LIKE GC: 742 [Synechococcus phage S-PM2]CAF34294.1 Hypothetical-Protein / belonging to T4-LIKE GC: 742 [Synechococcus phage S-PM2]CFW42471.1 hypothetical protein S-PM2d229 [Synechococcus phage S-PM2]
MELNTNYTSTYFEDFIGSAAVAKQKCIIFLRSWGWNNTKDIDAINASMDVYKSLIPLDIFTALHQSEFVFIEADSVEEAMIFCEDAFPESQSSVSNQANYIFYAVYNKQGQLITSNE